MNLSRLLNGLTLSLLLCILVLSGLVAWEWSAPVSLPEVDSRQPEQAAGDGAANGVEQAAGVFVAPPVDEFREILERPLFTEGRTPVSDPEEVEVPESVPENLRLQLEGIAISPASRVAIFRDLDSSELVSLIEGMTHKGWEVDSVEPQRAVLKKGEQVREFELEIEKAGEPPSAGRQRSGVRRFIPSLPPGITPPKAR